jgi:alpha-D-xyloside xylohydrolase
LTATFDGNENERLFGIGQYQMEELDVMHCPFELAHRNSQASIPFVLSSLGYGFLWHNPAIGEAHFGKNRTTWVANATKQLDYWITAGDSPREIESAYAKATGTVPMMPQYGLGFWQCKLRYWNQEQLLNVAREYKRRGLPIDVILCDFFHWPYMGDFRFDPEFWPDPEAMVDELKAMGIELMVSVWPQIDLRSENYEEMKRLGLLVKAERGEQLGMRFGGDSMFYDATNPRARQYVWEKCKQNYYDYGIKVFLLDEAEPEYGSYDFDNYRYHMGPNAQIGNVYPQLFSRGFYDGMAAEGQQNSVNLVRCAWAGSQRYGALLWSGDVFCSFDVFRKQHGADGGGPEF